MHAGRIKRNAESSPLLRLPLEIRRKILIEVLGDRLIHLKKFDDDAVRFFDSDESTYDTRRFERWHVLVCDPAAAEPIERGHREQGKPEDGDGAETSQESDVSTNSSSNEESSNGESSTEDEDSDQVTDDESLSSVTASHGRYWKKKTRIAEKLKRMSQRKVQRLIGHGPENNYSWWKLDHPFGDGPVMRQSRSRGRYAHMRVTHLGLLRTCRQLYTEANPVLWETNIFSFNDVHSFTCFMNDRTNHQKSLLKKLRLAMGFRPVGVPSWSKSLTMALVKSLQGLRFLWVSIHHRPQIRFETLEKIGVLIWTVFHATHLDGIRKLATLPLTWVRVSVTNKNLGDYDLSDLSKLWTQQQREKYADMIRTRLLAVDGAELFQQEKEEMKAYWQREKEREEEQKAMRRPLRLNLPA